MTQSENSQRYACFGDFAIDRETCDLTHQGAPVKLAAQPSRLLCLLVENAGSLVSREQIRRHLWPDRIVDYDTGINACILQIRRVLKRGDAEEGLIETVPRVGYRFLPSVDLRGSAHGPSDTSASNWRLHRQWTVAGVAVALLVVVFLFARRVEVPSAEPTRVAVLPFADLDAEFGAAAKRPHFSLGLTEELIVELAAIDPEVLQVVARTSASHYRDSRPPVAELASELEADYLVDGSIRHEDGRVRVVAELVRAEDEARVWSARYDRSFSEALDLQLEVANAIATSLMPHLADSSQLAQVPETPVAAEAREAWLIARHLLSRKPAEFEKAIEWSERSIALAPTFAPAYVTLAEALVSTPQSTPRRLALVEKALELDPALAEAQLLRGRFALFADWDFLTAESSFRRAIAEGPSLSDAHRSLAMLLAMTGRFDEAIDSFEAARSLDPVSSALVADGAMVYFLARRYDEAIAAYERALQLNPDSPSLIEALFDAHLIQGRTVQALEYARQLIAARGGPFELTQELESAATPKEALDVYHRHTLRYLEERSAPPVSLAGALLNVVRVDDAFSQLEVALANRSPAILFVPADPRADAYRFDRRFVDLTHSLGLDRFEFFEGDSKAGDRASG